MSADLEIGGPADEVEFGLVASDVVTEDPGLCLILDLAAAHRAVMLAMTRTLRPHGLSFAGYEALVLLLHSGETQPTVSEVGRWMQVHTTTASSCLARLERDGFVSRLRDAQDGRVVRTRLTPLGRSAAGAASEDMILEVFGDLGVSSSELGSLLDLLRKFRQGAGDFVEDGQLLTVHVGVPSAVASVDYR